MLNPFLKVEWLKEGRNVRLPMIIIFIMQFLHLSQFYLCFLMQNLYRKAIPIIPLLICISF